MKTTEESLQRAASCGGGTEFPGYSEDQRNDQESCSAYKTRQSSTADRFFDQQFVVFEPCF